MISHSLKYILVFFLSITYLPVLGQPVIFLSKKESSVTIRNENYFIYVDSNATASIENIQHKTFSPTTEPLLFTNPNYSYWIKFDVKNISNLDGTWVLEGYNFRIDSTQCLICEQENCIAESSGSDMDFDQRDFKHKNQTILIPFTKGQQKTVYLKFKNYFPTGTFLVIRHTNEFSQHAFSEYFLLGLFYGFIGLIAFYNLLLFFSTRASAFLYYMLYVLCTGIFFLSQDGLGFQFVWPGIPYLNKISNMASFCLMTLFLLLYSSSFLNYKLYFPALNKWIPYYFVLRIIIMIGTIIWFPELHYLYIDFLPFMLVYATAFYTYRKGLSISIFFITGFSILLVVFAIHAIRLTGIVTPNAFFFYILNIGVLLEMIVLGIGLAVKIRNLKDQEKIKDQLEQMVKERTEELDNYLYKTSHDINGPLKTIIGLSDLGKMDAEYSSKYFELIHQTGSKLDRVLHSLGEITTLNKAIIGKENIVVSHLLEEVKIHIKHAYSKCECTLQFSGSIQIQSDRLLFYLGLKNLVDFSLRRNSNSENRKINIQCFEKDAQLIIEIVDDSILIDKKEIKFAFNIFKRLDVDKTTGLELYSAKKAFDRIGATLELQNDFNVNLFRIKFPL